MSRHITHRCYIDESGDEGFKFGHGSTEWFFLTGIIVRDEDDHKLRAFRAALLKELWTDRNQCTPGKLHWKKLDHNRKLAIATRLRDQPVCCINVGIWKPKLDRACYINRADLLFNYAARLLLERMSWHIASHRGWAHITFSNRTRFRLDLLQAYVTQILSTSRNEIRAVFDPQDIDVRTMDQVDLLQIADACAGAAQDAFDPDPYGNTHPYYLLAMADRLYRRNGKVFGYGLKLFPDKAFFAECKQRFPFVESLGIKQ